MEAVGAFACTHCGARSASVLERCPRCGAFGCILPATGPRRAGGASSLAVRASEVPRTRIRARSTGQKVLDEVLGGGLVVPSTVAVYGRPGSRKSTFFAAAAERIGGERALYLCPEMTTRQLVDAAERLVRPPLRMLIAGIDRGSSDFERCMGELAALAPRVVVYDSIQSFETRGEVAGSDAAVREVVRRGRRAAATMGHLAIFISQVNGEGEPAGPKRTIHDCDTVVRMTPETPSDPGRVVVEKNRFFPSPREALIPRSPA